MTHFPKVPAITLACLSLIGCDSIKTTLSALEETALQAIAPSSDDGQEADVPIDPELEKLIDRNDEGILFRKDLPFPGELSVEVLCEESVNARLIRESQLGKDKISVASDSETGFRLDKHAGTFRFSDFRQTHHEQSVVNEEEGPRQIRDHPLAPPSPPKDFALELRDSGWGAKSRHFADISIAREIGPYVPELLQEYGLAPRAMWFGKRRIAQGTTIDISGELMPMLIPGHATGSLTITLRDIESVHGHPCARFSIHGSFHRNKIPSVDGRLHDEETTIQSGDIWLSVIHPVVLRSRLDCISTITYREGSGPALLVQGNFKKSRTLAWKGF